MATIKENNTENEVSVKQSFVQKHTKAIIACVSAVVIAIVGIFCYKQFYSNPRQDKASTAIQAPQFKAEDALMAEAQAAQYLNDATGAMTDSLYNVALNGDKNAKKVGFLQIIKDYSGTDAANLANLYAGLCYAHMGKWQEAQKYLDEFDTKGDAMISPMAVCARGDVYANLKQTDKAIEAFKKAVEMADNQCIDEANNAISPMIILKEAYQLKEKKDNKGALELLQNAKKKYAAVAAGQNADYEALIAELTQIVK